MAGSKKQNILLLTVICCASLALISIAFAALSSTLKLSGQASVAAQSWDIDFTNTVGTKWTTAQSLTGTKTNLAELPTSSSGAFGLPLDQTASGFLGSLRMSGDKITYTWYVQNFGTFEAKYSISGLISTSMYLSGSNVDISCNTSDNNTDKTFCNNYVKTTLTIDGVVADASSSYTLAKAGETGDSSILVLTIEIIGDNQIYTATASAYEDKYNNANPSMLVGGIEMLDSSNDLNISVTGLTLSGTQSVADTTPITNATTKVSYESYKGEIETYSYTGSSQEFTAKYPGNYKIELWGAQGGINSTNNTKGGYGAYTSGIIQLDKNETLYIYVGGMGKSILGDGAGWNGGGSTIGWKTEGYESGGGGATDVRLVNGTWSNFDSLKSRIMVAAGGGGDADYGSPGAAAGGLNGYSSSPCERSDCIGTAIVPTGGTQTSGGSAGSDICGTAYYTGSSNAGTFGIGGSTTYLTSITFDQNKAGTAGGAWVAGAGGGGYYGGGGGMSHHSSSGAGGSSFISGHDGCIAISESSTSTNIISTSSSIHYSGKSFSSTTMIDGNGYSWTTSVGSQTGMPSYDGNSTMTGNTGNGYAKITYLGE